MVTNLDEDRESDGERVDPDAAGALRPTDAPAGDGPASPVARVIAEEFGGRALCEFGRGPTAVAARRIARNRTGREPTPLPEACADRNLDVATVARAENALLSELGAPADPEEIRLLAGRVERCRQVLVATARERAGPPRVTSVLCGGTTPDDPDPEDVTVPEDVEPLPPDESAEELKAYYHRLGSDLRCARLGFRLYEAVVEAELGGPPR